MSVGTSRDSRKELRDIPLYFCTNCVNEDDWKEKCDAAWCRQPARYVIFHFDSEATTNGREWLFSCKKHMIFIK